MISVQRVPKTKSIVVLGITDDMTDDLIRLYFENEKRSGGGDIVGFSRKESCVIITFEHREGNLLAPLILHSFRLRWHSPCSFSSFF
jgi:hypothetical protein